MCGWWHSHNPHHRRRNYPGNVLHGISIGAVDDGPLGSDGATIAAPSFFSATSMPTVAPTCFATM
jgi:hypothetical protein